MKLCAAVPGDEAAKIAAVKRLGLAGTALGIDPAGSSADAQRAIAPYRAAAVPIVQTGCYRNLIAVDPAVRGMAIRDVSRTMELAGDVGIPSVICGGGHRHPDLSAEVFAVHPETWSDRAIEILIESCLRIVESVSDRAATLCLEPWVITSLDSPERLDRVVRRVNHPKLAVELDPVNLMTIERYANTTRFLRECFDLLGDQIRLVHAKDTLLKPTPFTFHLSEAIPGEGTLDYETLLRQMEQLPPATPLLIEHLPDEASIGRARDYIVGVAARLNQSIISREVWEV